MELSLKWKCKAVRFFFQRKQCLDTRFLLRTPNLCFSFLLSWAHSWILASWPRSWNCWAIFTSLLRVLPNRAPCRWLSSEIVPLHCCIAADRGAFFNWSEAALLWCWIWRSWTALFALLIERPLMNSQKIDEWEWSSADQQKVVDRFKWDQLHYNKRTHSNGHSRRSVLDMNVLHNGHYVVLNISLLTRSPIFVALFIGLSLINSFTQMLNDRQ